LSGPLDAPPLARSATVVWHGSSVFDADHLEPGGLQGSDCRLTARTGAFDQNVDASHAVLLCAPGSGFGGELGCIGRGLPRALETNIAGRCPGQHVTLPIRDRDDGVVERRPDVDDTVDDVLLLPTACSSCLLWRCQASAPLLLCLDLLLPGHGLLRSLASAGIRVGPLAVNRKPPPVPQALIATDVDLALDVLVDVAA
jgi:hypothetical protein